MSEALGQLWSPRDQKLRRPPYPSVFLPCRSDLISERCELSVGSPVLRDAVQSALRQSHGRELAEIVRRHLFFQLSGFHVALK